MDKLINKTTTIDGMMAVSENDLGLKYVQFLPDNPLDRATLYRKSENATNLSLRDITQVCRFAPTDMTE